MKPGARQESSKPLWMIALALLALDAGFLHEVWRHFPNWGIWDWDLHTSLLEVARRSILVDGEVPLWNRFRGGGWTLVGNSLARTFNPSFLPPLLFGSVAGIKIALLVYLWIAQLGFLRLGRFLGMGTWPALMGAFVFSWGGCFAQHFTHGHYEWLGYAWLPWVLLGLHRAWERTTPSRLAAGGIPLALVWLDGGPYQLAFTALFIGLYALCYAASRRSALPLATSLAIGAIAAVLSAVQLVPVAETARRIPRPTAERTGYFGLEQQPSAAQVLSQGFVARDQRHAVDGTAPFRLNVGAYVGVLPLLLAALALLRRRDALWLGAVLTGCLWMMLSEELPVAPWSLLHRLPGFSSLMVPARFNVFVLLSLALLAARGLQELSERMPRRPAAALLVALVALDLFAVNSRVLEVAFSVPPIPVEPRDRFVQIRSSPYLEEYAARAIHPLDARWPNATFPTILENTGVIFAYRDLLHPRLAIAFDDPTYPGQEVFPVRGAVQVIGYRQTSNRVAFEVVGNGGRVAVNQNHHPGWRLASDAGARVVRHRGLLAVDLPAGRHSIELEFRPASFLLGAALSIVGWLGVLGLLVYSRYPRARRAS